MYLKQSVGLVIDAMKLTKLMAMVVLKPMCICTISNTLTVGKFRKAILPTQLPLVPNQKAKRSAHGKMNAHSSLLRTISTGSILAQ